MNQINLISNYYVLLLQLDSWTKLETLNLSRNQLSGLPVSLILLRHGVFYNILNFLCFQTRSIRFLKTVTSCYSLTSRDSSFHRGVEKVLFGRLVDLQRASPACSCGF